MFGTPGQPCSSPGQLACAGANQQQALLCNAGAWQVLATCAANQRCDRASGVCADVAAGCDGRAPGFRFCRDAATLATCGPDLVTAPASPCCGACVAGTCEGPRCGNGRREGDETCDDGNTTPADGCEPDCRPTEVIALAAGRAHTCALLGGGNVRCWGTNDKGQLGIGTTTDVGAGQPYDNPIVGLGAGAVAVQIAVGNDHTCALLATGALRCWGANDRGQLGLGHTRNIGDDELPGASAATVNLGVAARTVAAGGEGTCVILMDGSLRCWGRNDYGQLGLGHTRTIGDDEPPSAANAAVSLGGQVSSVGLGGYHACAVLSDRLTGRCWGRNGKGELGLGIVPNVGDDELPDSVAPIMFFADSPVVGIAVSASRACALREDGNEICWGDTSDGGLGINLVGYDPLRKATDWGIFGWHALAIAAGAYHACAALNTNQLRCWGRNEKGQLGLAHLLIIGDNESAFEAPAVDLGLGLDGFPASTRAVVAGDRHTCALLLDGQVRCWGANESGQLGLGFKSLPPVDYVGGTAATVPGKLATVRVY
jgi:cysteine-rich repeat protein